MDHGGGLCCRWRLSARRVEISEDERSGALNENGIRTKIAGMAVTVPKERVDLLDLGFDAYTMQRTMKLTGVRSVRYAADGMTSSDYCLDAAQALLVELSVPGESVDGIVFLTPHPDYYYPGNTGTIQSRLGLSKRCVALDVNHACTAMVYGLYLADLVIRAGECHNVLVCCGDTSSRHLHPKDRAMRMVIGDGGAAALVTAGGEHLSKYAFFHDGDRMRTLYTPAGGERMPICPGVTDREETDAEGNVRTLEHEYMDGMEVMRFVMHEVPPLIDVVLQKSEWTHEDASVYALHQANVFIVKSLMRAMQLPKDKVLIDIDGIGNIGGASVALALCNAAQTADTAGWDKSVLAGFGSGLSAAAMTADLSETVFLPMREL